MQARDAAALVLLAAAGCALRARHHACYPWVARQWDGHPPPAVLRTLARERDTRRRVGRSRAPSGYYWRRRTPPSRELEDVRSGAGDYELARCPGGVVRQQP